jgi:spore coat protein U-like protein
MIHIKRRFFPNIVGRLAISIATTFIISLPGLAQAGGVSASTQATAAISANCTISATDISFGTIALNKTTNMANGAIRVLCTKNSNYSIGMSFGTPDPNGYTLNGKYNDGMMIGENYHDVVTYAITSSNGAPYSWGLQGAVVGTGTGAVQTYPTYGIATTGYFGHSYYPTPDNYSDTVTVTLSY